MHLPQTFQHKIPAPTSRKEEGRKREERGEARERGRDRETKVGGRGRVGGRKGNSLGYFKSKQHIYLEPEFLPLGFYLTNIVAYL